MEGGTLQVFLSYRRDDSAPRAGRLRDALAARFGAGNIFQDVVAVAPGTRFDDAIESALARCDATIAVIGPGWLTTADADGEPRLTNADDFVRRELTMALSRATPTIPVLVGGATMPTAEQLPEELRPLVLRQAITLRDDTWLDDVERLVIWLTGGDGDEANESTDTTPASNTVFDPVTASLPACPTPQPPDWTDLDMAGGPTTDAGWRFEVVGAFHRDAGNDPRDLILQTLATNLNVGSMYHYPFYAVLVDGNRFTPTCFSIRSGPDRIDPGGASEALVGFTGPSETPESISIEVADSGNNYRLDLTAPTD